MVLDQPVTAVYPGITDYVSPATAGSLDSYEGAPGQLGHSDDLGLRRAGERRQLNQAGRLPGAAAAERFIIGLNGTNAGGYSVKLTTNPGGGRGGTCFGNSGGPILIGDTATAVNSFVMNGACAGTGFAYQIDTEDVIAFISGAPGTRPTKSISSPFDALLTGPSCHGR
ncbi:hypothetical protein SAMN05660657_02326 [Geodermatophilus amargosae]|uniref:Trypsin n=1 Tax=Geodermatophilus amargosae TaxID=1296565 RepID=A0A1I6ZXH4_9ACTN|nr:hypothetical protein [Geodermatophilus amargosae]SFT67325.1 hypothetical protein SAMN05660657_02326 [Geodermatophilus amargosae]